MEITVHNLGAIKKAKVSIKPLTVFVGPNNTGKTWLAYTIAGIFSSSRFNETLISIEEKIRIYAPLEESIDQSLRDGSAILNMVEFADKYGEVYLNDIAHNTREWLPGFMNSRLASFEATDISFSLADTKPTFLKKILNSAFQLEMHYKRNTWLGVRKKAGESQLYIYIIEKAGVDDSSEKRQINEFPIPFIKELIFSLILQVIRTSFYPQVRILPTERTTALTFPIAGRRDQIESLTVSNQSSQALNLKSVIGPVDTFLNMLSNAYSTDVKARRERSQRGKSEIATFSQLAQILEEQILEGKVEFTPLETSLVEGSNQLELGLARGLIFRTASGPELEISIASSMVKELAPLVLYLRDIASQGDLLIIDEPEKSLHPEAQAKMIEFLATLVNAGLNVIFTTHSPYVVDHLANLIKANDNENKELIKDAFYLKRKDAFISKDKVSVYMFNQGQAQNVLDNEGVIDLNTFGRVSDRISEIYFAL